MENRNRLTAVIYGSAFNPPHAGHFSCAKWLAGRFGVVFVTPSAAHAFGKNTPPFDERMRLVLKAASHFAPAADRIIVSDVERGILADKTAAGKDPVVYSIDVLERMSSMFPGLAFSLAVGPDNALPEIISRFHRIDDVLDRFNLVVCPSFPGPRSTEIRSAAECGSEAVKKTMAPFLGNIFDDVMSPYSHWSAPVDSGATPATR